jgi:hypothetical protein
MQKAGVPGFATQLPIRHLTAEHMCGGPLAQSRGGELFSKP